MKKLIYLTLILLIGSLALVFAQKVKEKSALESMVEAERAFARMSLRRTNDS